MEDGCPSALPFAINQDVSPHYSVPERASGCAIEPCLERSYPRWQGARTLQPNWQPPSPVSARAQGYPTAADYPLTCLDGLEALRQAANQREPLRARDRTPSSSFADIPLHAAPLSPLRDRDIEVLADWFESELMPEIEADVDRCLLVLWPAPCWEDDPLEFLDGF
jgi:hypothetical protein